MKGFILYPFDTTWKNIVYHIIVDLIINRVLLPKYDFNYAVVMYQFNLKNIEVSSKRGFRVPQIGNDHENILVLIGMLLNCRWFWNESNREVKKILRVMKKKYEGEALGEIYYLMCKRLQKIEGIDSYSSAYKTAKALSDEIENIFREKKISFTEVQI